MQVINTYDESSKHGEFDVNYFGWSVCTSPYVSSKFFINQLEVPIFNFPNDGSVNASIEFYFDSDSFLQRGTFLMRCSLDLA